MNTQHEELKSSSIRTRKFALVRFLQTLPITDTLISDR